MIFGDIDLVGRVQTYVHKVGPCRAGLLPSSACCSRAIHVGNREKGTKSKTEALYVPSMWRGYKKYEDIPSEEIDDIELVGDDFAPST